MTDEQLKKCFKKIDEISVRYRDTIGQYDFNNLGIDEVAERAKSLLQRISKWAKEPTSIGLFYDEDVIIDWRYQENLQEFNSCIIVKSDGHNEYDCRYRGTLFSTQEDIDLPESIIKVISE